MSTAILRVCNMQLHARHCTLQTVFCPIVPLDISVYDIHYARQTLSKAEQAQQETKDSLECAMSCMHVLQETLHDLSCKLCPRLAPGISSQTQEVHCSELIMIMTETPEQSTPRLLCQVENHSGSLYRHSIKAFDYCNEARLCVVCLVEVVRGFASMTAQACPGSLSGAPATRSAAPSAACLL